MKKLIFSTIFLLFLTHLVFSQQRTISGTVTSEDDGLRLPGVSVVIKNTTRGAVSDLDGNFSITDVNPTDTLVFSFVGFVPQEILVEEKITINIQLATAAEEIEGVVVTALGIKRQKREIGYSTEKINTDAIVRSSSPNWDFNLLNSSLVWSSSYNLNDAVLECSFPILDVDPHLEYLWPWPSSALKWIHL